MFNRFSRGSVTHLKVKLAALLFALGRLIQLLSVCSCFTLNKRDVTIMLIFGTRTLGYLCLQYVMLSGTGAVLNSPDGMGMQVVKLLLLCRCHRLRSSTGQSSGHGDG